MFGSAVFGCPEMICILFTVSRDFRNQLLHNQTKRRLWKEPFKPLSLFRCADVSQQRWRSANRFLSTYSVTVSLGSVTHQNDVALLAMTASQAKMINIQWHNCPSMKCYTSYCWEHPNRKLIQLQSSRTVVSMSPSSTRRFIHNWSYSETKSY